MAPHEREQLSLFLPELSLHHWVARLFTCKDYKSQSDNWSLLDKIGYNWTRNWTMILANEFE
jgi:hypothetical protein